MSLRHDSYDWSVCLEVAVASCLLLRGGRPFLLSLVRGLQCMIATICYSIVQYSYTRRSGYEVLRALYCT